MTTKLRCARPQVQAAGRLSPLKARSQAPTKLLPLGVFSVNNLPRGRSAPFEPL